MMNINSSFFLLALSFNVLDFITSYVDFQWFGMSELNAFSVMLRLDDYLALLFSFLVYQLVVVVLYVLSIRCWCVFPVFVVFVLFKVVAVVNNVLVVLGINGMASFITRVDYDLFNPLYWHQSFIKGFLTVFVHGLG